MERHLFTAFFCLALQAPAQNLPLGIVSRQTLLDRGPGLVGVSLSPQNELYLIGSSSSYAFPAPTISLGDTGNPLTTEYVLKLDSANHVLFNVAVSTVYGIDINLVFDAESNPYVYGMASSAKLPATPGAYRTSVVGNVGYFVCKLRRDTGIPAYCTYLDNVGDKLPLYADASGAIYVVGSNPGGVTATPGALSRGSIIYVGKLNPQGSAMSYIATFGGPVPDHPVDFAVDSTGAVTVAGLTYLKDFPTTAGAAVPDYPDGATKTGFVARINPAGTDFEYSTFGSTNETINSIGLGSDRSTFVSALRSSGSFSVRKYSPDGSAILFDVPVPQFSQATAKPIADSNGGALVLGSTTQTNIAQIAGTARCSFRAGAKKAGVLVHLSAEGKIVQSTYLADSTYPSFQLYSTGDDRVTLLEYASPGPHTNLLSAITLAPTSGNAPPISCMGNGASFAAASIAPGEIVTLFGNALVPAAPLVLQPGGGGRFPLEAAGMDIMFDGVRGALLYISPTQINAVAPWALREDGVSHVCLRNNGIESDCIDVGAAPVAPGIFRASDGKAAAVNQDGTINSASNPAAADSIVSLFVTGLGQVDPIPLDGAVTQFPLPSLVWGSQTQVLVQVIPVLGHITYFSPLFTTFIGSAPLEITGLQQINVQISKIQPTYVSVTLPDGRQFTDNAMIWIK